METKELTIWWSLTNRLIGLQTVKEQYNVVKFNKKRYVEYMAVDVEDDDVIQKRCNLLAKLCASDFDIFPDKKHGFTIFKIHLN